MGFNSAFKALKKLSKLQQLQLWHSQDRVSWYILIIKANKMHYLSTLFW